MQRLLVEIGQHIEDGNIEKIVEIDTAFHDVLYKASRNKRLAGIINNLREQIRAKIPKIQETARRWPISTCWLRWQKRRLNITILSRN